MVNFDLRKIVLVILLTGLELVGASTCVDLFSARLNSNKYGDETNEGLARTVLTAEQNLFAGAAVRVKKYATNSNYDLLGGISQYSPASVINEYLDANKSRSRWVRKKCEEFNKESFCEELKVKTAEYLDLLIGNLHVLVARLGVEGRAGALKPFTDEERAGYLAAVKTSIEINEDIYSSMCGQLNTVIYKIPARYNFGL
jgi:hypothetical protein